MPSDYTCVLGSCLDHIGSIPKDAYIVMDPPYGIGYIGSPGTTAPDGIYKGKRPKRTRETVIGDDVPFEPERWLAWPCAMWGAQHYFTRLPQTGSLHCWDKCGDYKKISYADADFVWVSRKTQSRVFRLVWRGLCRHTENFERCVHPTQKPVQLMQWVFDMLDVPVGATVVDPYMGSGTTGVAALLTGRKFIGFEIDPVHYKTAMGRLATAAPLFAGGGGVIYEAVPIYGSQSTSIAAYYAVEGPIGCVCRFSTLDAAEACALMLNEAYGAGVESMTPRAVEVLRAAAGVRRAVGVKR